MSGVWVSERSNNNFLSQYMDINNLSEEPNSPSSQVILNNSFDICTALSIQILDITLA